MTQQITEVRTAEDRRRELRDSFEQLLDEWRRGLCGSAWVDMSIEDYRPGLSPFARWAAWEDFTDAVDKLAELRDPMFDPATLDEDPEVAEHRYEERAEAFITTLMGGAR